MGGGHISNITMSVPSMTYVLSKYKYSYLILSTLYGHTKMLVLFKTPLRYNISGRIPNKSFYYKSTVIN